MQKPKTLKVKMNNAARDVLRGYPLDWPIRSWFVRVVRARNRCEWCGARNHHPHPDTGSHVRPDDGARLRPRAGGGLPAQPRCPVPALPSEP